MRASMAAHQESALAKERAAIAKLCAHIQKLKASLLALEARHKTCPLGLSPADLHHACHAQKLTGHPKNDLLSSLIEHACQRCVTLYSCAAGKMRSC